MSFSKTIAVLGGTGTTGSQVIKALLSSPNPPKIIALVRSPEKARSKIPSEVTLVPIRDSTDVTSVTKALEGVDALYAMSPPQAEIQVTSDAVTALVRPFPCFGHIFGNERNGVMANSHVMKAAFNAKVKHIVYLSCIGADPLSNIGVVRAHGIAEQIYKHYHHSLTVLRPSWFMDNFLTQTRTLYLPPTAPPVPYISAQDIGLAAAKALSDGPEQHAGKIYELYDPKILSYPEISSIIGESLEVPKPAVVEISNEEMVKALEGLGDSEFSARSSKYHLLSKLQHLQW
ncbi:hypothetical protein HK097_011425 [Rhizophlyctis rosea]|uniref:NAD(P)-binding domain-containing protein n=1 Tax=Rhizophlyctis rosea TaxID=64517 RepID=A0AAD5WZ85_9FUNG|nr:hypothetical protein HK097_011425 [Rhizophlyctis rosea]